MFQRIIFVFLGILLCLGLGTGAENTSDPATTGKEEPDQENVLVEKIEVVGHVETKRASQSVTVLDKKDFQWFTETDIKAILNLSPGFLALSGGHPGQITYSYARGASVNQSLFLIDGFKISDPASSIGLNTSLFSSALFVQAEIVRGPLSCLLGSNAMGGAVNMQSRRDEGIEATFFAGSHGTYDGHIDFAKKLGDFFVHVNGNWLSYSDGVENDDFLNRGVMVKGGYGDKKLQIGLLFFGNLAESGIPVNLGEFSPNRRYWQDNYLVGLPLVLNLGRDSILRIRLSHQGNRYEFQDPDDTWTPYYQNSSTINEGEIQLETRLSRHLRLQAGLDTAAQRVQNKDTDGQILEVEKTNYSSAFVNAGLELRRFTLSASFRYDKYKYLDGVISPQLGISYLAAEWLRIRGSYSRSFRAPTLPELFNPMWGNSNLQPERAESWEIGAEIYTRSAILSLVYFDSAYSNLIGYNPTTWVFDNIDEADISGLEIAARLRLWRLVQVRAAYAYLNTHDLKNDQELLRRPKHALSLMITYDNPHFSLSGEMRYVGRRLDYDELLWATGESPAFNVYNFSLRVPLNRRLSLVGKATNAFDREYEEILGYPTPGRRFLLGIRYKIL